MKYHLNSCPSEWLMGDTARTTHWKGGLLPPLRSCKVDLTEILHVLSVSMKYYYQYHEVSLAITGHSTFLSSDTKLR